MRHPNRRHLIAGLGAAALAMPGAHAQERSGAGPLYAIDFGVVPEIGEDQSAAMAAAFEAAETNSRPLVLPPGIIFVRDLTFPGAGLIEGVPGLTMLTALGEAAVGRIFNANGLVLRGVGLSGSDMGTTDALLRIQTSLNVTLDQCVVQNSTQNGLWIEDSSATITDCIFSGHEDAAIHSIDSRGLMVRGNRIQDCGNAGIRVWRSEPGPDGSIVTGNRVEHIDWRGGGNGQNGNGINIFRADGVVISGNHISDCAFTAVRLNSTNNTIVSANVCLKSGEVAIFSEFAFSGSVIADNVIDGAAFGISMTNLDQGGQLATCSGNVVRNITPSSLVNPDTTPGGIFAEANAVITGNTVQSVPGIALGAGHGPYLDNVSITNNVVSDCDVGIGVSVVEDCGPVFIAGNLIKAPRLHAAIGLRWSEIEEPDLFANAERFAHVTIGQNAVAG